MMAVDKLVDSAQLNTDLTAVANAIRAKSGGSTPLAFPGGFVSEIGSISGGDTVYAAPQSGYLYTPDYTQTVTVNSWQTNDIVPSNYAFAGATELVNYRLITTPERTVAFDNKRQSFFSGCSKLETVWLDIQSGYLTGASMFHGCTSLKSVIVGNIGKPFTANDIPANRFEGNGSIETVTFYVNAETMEDVPANLINRQPFGAPNATIIYRNSTTGEVITA